MPVADAFKVENLIYVLNLPLLVSRYHMNMFISHRTAPTQLEQMHLRGCTAHQRTQEVYVHTASTILLHHHWQAIRRQDISTAPTKHCCQCRPRTSFSFASVARSWYRSPWQMPQLAFSNSLGSDAVISAPWISGAVHSLLTFRTVCTNSPGIGEQMRWIHDGSDMMI